MRLERLANKLGWIVKPKEYYPFVTFEYANDYVMTLIKLDEDNWRVFSLSDELKKICQYLYNHDCMKKKFITKREEFTKVTEAINYFKYGI